MNCFEEWEQEKQKMKELAKKFCDPYYQRKLTLVQQHQENLLTKQCLKRLIELDKLCKEEEKKNPDPNRPKRVLFFWRRLKGVRAAGERALNCCL